MLTKPVFTLDKPNPNPTYITDAEWWLWLRLHELEPSTELGGIYANKKGFHNTGKANTENWPGNYSIIDPPNKRGPWWWTKASALDWTFPNAQAGNYTTIDKYAQRLMSSALNSNDPRLDLIMFEFFGQTDTDTHVEGYDEYHEEYSTSDSSHLWHIHISFLRDKCGDFWGMWALLTVLMGWSVDQWKATLPNTPLPVEDWTAKLVMSLPTIQKGSTGTTVRTWQGLLCARGFTVAIDGVFGDGTEAKTKALQTKYGADRGIDGIVGEETWWIGLTAVDKV